MQGVAVASSTKLAADAGAIVADSGGNAVDVAVAAALVSITTEPAICALGAGGFLTIWPAAGEPVTIDGYIEMPGRGLPPGRFGGGRRDVWIGYGGGVDITVGHGSVGTPGGLAALALASSTYGRLPWAEVVEPAYQDVKNGFALSVASYTYLEHAADRVFGWNEPSYRALHHADGTLRRPGETVWIEELAHTLRRIADHGADELYVGETARLIAADMQANGGVLTLEDLATYRPIVRRPLVTGVHGWEVATNPPPAIGGTVLTAMLLLMQNEPVDRWGPREVAWLARVQEAVLDYRIENLDMSDDLETDLASMLDAARVGELKRWVTAPSTVHTSAVDADGLACSVTMSAGYGSGVMPPGTGVWMNNCLGEHELNRRGYHQWSPGTRLPSNMAPTVARHPDGSVLSIGSPGADRITTAILQVLVNHLHLGMSLGEAIGHPRLHVESHGGARVAACEPGLPLQDLTIPARRFDSLSMYFGGAGAAKRCADGRFEVAADPRRGGGTTIGGR
ncbi:MAG: gamma-glutamyltransferase [Candidatus Palauibacterales bacterium]|jgi:gamma-glutamyltranspeptidase / glutathione hydrolase|nr:gamma-glutamyltransferase [Candidatus Palauibacterales bacterium]